MRSLLKIILPYSLFVGVGVAIFLSSNRRTAESVVVRAPDGRRDARAPSDAVRSASAAEGIAFDPVCHMEVNPSWGFHAEIDGRRFSFCTRRCRDRFVASPGEFLGERCVVCKVPIEVGSAKTATYLGKAYELCSEAHRREFKTDPAAFFMHTMWGIPPWMYYCSIALVLMVSFGLFEGGWAGAKRTPVMAAPGQLNILSQPVINPPARIHDFKTNRIDLLRIPFVHALATSRGFRFACQAVMVGLFFLVIAAGLFGNQNPALNIAPILTWTVWWGGLVILIMFAGKAWCYVCPWDAVAGWMEKLRFWKKTDEGLGLDLKWPAVVRNILLATLLFVGLTWVELGFGVTMKPRVTAYLALAMLLMAIVSAFLFRRKSFCRYGCLVGRVSGLYAMFSGIEVRARDQSVCKSCTGKECVRGSEQAYGCPTFLYPGGLTENTYCIQCTECIQACPEDNLALNLRPWGADLVAEHKPRTDEAYLALLMLSITGFHGLTMTANWARLTGWLGETFSLGRMLAFSLGMTLLLLAPILVYAFLVTVSYRLGRRRVNITMTQHDYFVRYAYTLLPIALFYHLAHNLEHLLMEGPKVVTLASDPFGWGWNLLGTTGWSVPPLVSLDVLWVLQILLVLVGHVYSLWVAGRTSSRLFGDRKAAFRSQLPMLAGMICFSIFSLWLLKQPMEMRTSAM